MRKTTTTFAIIAMGCVMLTTSISAETAKIGDLSKSGYNCRQTGEQAHVCSRGTEDPVFECVQLDCKSISSATTGEQPTRGKPKVGIENTTTSPAGVQ
jgi:hypothetical protein